MKKKRFYTNLMILMGVILLPACITPFTPNGLGTQGGTLAIEGDIILNGDSKIYLSLSKDLQSDDEITYVTSAQVWVESERGTQYAGVLQADPNTQPYYLIHTNNLDVETSYKLCINLADGNLYESDFLTPYPTSEIESIDYIVDDTKTVVDFFVTSYGNENISRYYKWRFREDWEINSLYVSNYFYDPNTDMIVPFTTVPNMYYCWNQAESSSILIAKTDHLDENTVYQQKLNTIYYLNDKISNLYSLELTQMSISHEAYIYWSALKKNTDEIGGIFAPQPNEMYGNIRCITNPALKALGYISAGIVASKRIFLTSEDIGIYVSSRCPFFDPLEASPPPGLPLTVRQIYELGYMVVKQDVYDSVNWAPITCVDCRARGTKNKPLFWPNDHI